MGEIGGGKGRGKKRRKRLDGRREWDGQERVGGGSGKGRREGQEGWKLEGWK